MSVFRSVLLTAATVAVLALSVSGCDTIRKATYPPDYHYLEKRDVAASMWRLSGSIIRLDQMLADDVEPGPHTRESIIEELRAIEVAARAVSAEGMPTHHLQFDRQMDRFLEDVRRARMHVQHEPPNYFLAGRLAGSCSGCHVLVR